MSRRSFFVLGACLALSPPWAEAADRNASGATAFNPKISLILDSQYSYYSRDADTNPANVGGVLLPPDAGFTKPGFSLGETELAVESNVDDQWHGWATISLAPEGGVSVEEAYVNTLALPEGFALKLGRFKSEIGYQNHVHAHAWEFADAPLPYRVLLNTQLQDDGAQARWVAPTDLLLEVGGELLRGQDAWPAGGDPKNGWHNYTSFVHVGGDAGDSGAWRVGLSHLWAKASHRLSGTTPNDTDFTGKSGLSILDLVYKWAPDGNPSVTNFVFNAEYFYRTERGGVVFNPAATTPGAAAPRTPSAYDGTQQGWYAQTIYQFMPRWRAGLRYDTVHASNTVPTPPGAGTDVDFLADTSYTPRRESVMVDFSNSEFSRIRLQYNRDETRPNGVKDNQVFVQFIYSLGSHPAHQF